MFQSEETMSVFSAPANNMVYKITCFQFRVGLANKNIRICPGTHPTEVIAIYPAI
jgi:hypothetical protein